MDQQELKEVLRKHLLWINGESGGEKANLRGADLREADLRGADLSEADLTRANLREADLREADLRETSLLEANLQEANLQSADLTRSNLREANLYRADLRGASLYGAVLRATYLRGADLSETDLTRANLEMANLYDADLSWAKLSEAKLSWTNLAMAKLYRAKLYRADLRAADLRGANLQGADLREANLSEANLFEANLSEANLSEANLQSADLTRANLEGAVLEGTLFEAMKIESKTAYGQKRSGVKALKTVSEPIKVAAFKRTFPEAFEAVKHDIGGGTLTPEAATALINRYGMTWQISTTKWKIELQRISPISNDVLQLNIDLKAVTDEEKLLKNIEAIRQVSFRSQHPVLRSGPLTIGWVRYSSFDTAILVEEVQSDLPIVRKGMSDAEFQRQLVAKGLSDSDIKQALDVLQPFVDRFYFDALALVLDIAAEAGLPVEMLSYEQKQQFGSPRSLYEELPKRMGMRKAASKLDFVTGKTWQISPNPVRRGRVRIPKTWSRK